LRREGRHFTSRSHGGTGPVPKTGGRHALRSRQNGQTAEGWAGLFVCLCNRVDTNKRDDPSSLHQNGRALLYADDSPIKSGFPRKLPKPKHEQPINSEEKPTWVHLVASCLRGVLRVRMEHSRSFRGYGNGTISESSKTSANARLVVTLVLVS